MKEEETTNATHEKCNSKPTVVKRKRFGLALVLTLVGLASMQAASSSPMAATTRSRILWHRLRLEPAQLQDDNPAVPDNPFFGEYHRTLDGIYDFEYFINPYEYWWGTYEIYVNPGTASGLRRRRPRRRRHLLDAHLQRQRLLL